MTEALKASIIARAERESSDEEDGEGGEAFAEDYDDDARRDVQTVRDGDAFSDAEDSSGPTAEAAPSASVRDSLLYFRSRARCSLKLGTDRTNPRPSQYNPRTSLLVLPNPLRSYFGRSSFASSSTPSDADGHGG